MEILTIVAIVANLLAIVFFLSPLLIVREMFKTKETNTVPSLLFLFTLFNCELWFIYGVQDNSWQVYLCNSIGWVLNIIYISIFLCFIKNLKKKIIFLILVYGLILITFVFFFQFLKDKSITGLLAMIINIIMFLSPLQKTREVFKFKTNAYLPFGTTLSLLLCSILWCTVGVLKNVDKYIIIPNSVGIAIGFFQIILYFYFRNHKGEVVTEGNLREEPPQAIQISE